MYQIIQLLDLSNIFILSLEKHMQDQEEAYASLILIRATNLNDFSSHNFFLSFTISGLILFRLMLK